MHQTPLRKPRSGRPHFWSMKAFVLGCTLASCGPADVSVPAVTLMLDPPVDYISPDSSQANEPMLVEHPDGTLFVCGYSGGGVPGLYQSQDKGSSWERVDLGSEEDGAVGNSDCDLAVGLDGSVFLAEMEWTPGTGGTAISVASRPAGEGRWHWTAISNELGADRPWIESAPDGTVHLVWNQGQHADSTRSRGVFHTKSEDSGRTWDPPRLIYEYGASSHFAVGPDGEMALRIIPHIRERGPRIFDGDFVAVSLDGGESWDLKPPPKVHNWEPEAYFEEVPRWVEPLAWDDSGTLYHLWSDINSLQLAWSTDQGTTWSFSEVTESTDTLYFPYMVASGRGELAVAWHVGGGMDLLVGAAYVRVDLEQGTVVDVHQVELPYDALGPWADDGSESRWPLGEYKPVAFLTDGDLGVVTPILNVFDGRSGFRWHRIRVLR